MKNWMVLSFVVFSEVIGNICLSHGMRQLGPVELTQLSVVFLTAGRMIGNPWVVVGVIFLILYFISYLEAFSRLELSVVLPIAASSYLMTTLISASVLHEVVSATRWLGTFAICVGILLVGRSQLEV